MSILIKGMGMPKNCDECFFVGRGFPDWCSLPQIPKDEDEIDDTNNRPDWCPLEEVPSEQPETHEKRTETHACDLIERQAVLDWLKNEWNGRIASLFDGIKAFPSAQPDVPDTNVGDTISRKAAIDVLGVGKELLSRVLDDTDVVGQDREKYSWGLGLIESYINDIEELPSAQAEIVRCKDCKHWMPHSQLGYDEDNETYHDYCEKKTYSR